MIFTAVLSFHVLEYIPIVGLFARPAHSLAFHQIAHQNDDDHDCESHAENQRQQDTVIRGIVLRWEEEIFNSNKNMKMAPFLC